MAIQYLVKLSLTLEPVWHQEPPKVITGIGANVTELELKNTTTVNFEFVSDRSCELVVEFCNKKDTDTVPDQNLDKAVIIKNIAFFGISDPKFVWAGEYEPLYPEPWASQQREQGIELQPRLTGHNYLSWNGKWTLTFDVPVFTWIHKTQNLGWIYG
jgi:hypothetical protein